MASFRTTRPELGYYRMLNSVSSADLYESQSGDEYDSYLEVEDPLVLPEGVYTVSRLISTRQFKVYYM